MNIRRITTLDECRQVASLEKTVWEFSDSEDVVPPALLIVSIKRGGLLLGAFDDVCPGAFSGFLERCDRHSYPQRLSTVVETLGGRDGVAWGGSTPPGNEAGL